MRHCSATSMEIVHTSIGVAARDAKRAVWNDIWEKLQGAHETTKTMVAHYGGDGRQVCNPPQAFSYASWWRASNDIPSGVK